MPVYRTPNTDIYFRHIDYVRKLVPKENLLEFEPGMGWEPLVYDTRSGRALIQENRSMAKGKLSGHVHYLLFPKVVQVLSA